jgi:hypothetical protein
MQTELEGVSLLLRFLFYILLDKHRDVCPVMGTRGQYRLGSLSSSVSILNFQLVRSNFEYSSNNALNNEIK